MSRSEEERAILIEDVDLLIAGLESGERIENRRCKIEHLRFLRELFVRNGSRGGPDSGPRKIRAGDMTQTLRRFILLRVEDVSGSSGTGVVAHGVVHSSGQTVVFFADSIKIFQSHEKLMEVHSHGGKTRFHWQDKD